MSEDNFLFSNGIDLEEIEEKFEERVANRTAPEMRNVPGRVVHLSSNRNVNYCWDEVRKEFILGRRKQLEDGSIVAENVTLKELSEKYGIKMTLIKEKSAKQNWGKLRKAYQERVTERNIGLELGLYTQEDYEAEVAAMNAANKLTVVLNKFIDYKFREILEDDQDVNSDGSNTSEELEQQINAVNRNTGTPVFINELKETVKVATDIYRLQKEIYRNAPNKDLETLDAKIKSSKDAKKSKSIEKIINNPQDRQEMINRLKQKLFESENQLKQVQELEQVEQNTIDV